MDPRNPSASSSHPILWFGLGLALFGTGYVVYNRVQEGKRRVAYLDKHAPDLLESLFPGFGKRIAEIGQARSRP